MAGGMGALETKESRCCFLLLSSSAQQKNDATLHWNYSIAFSTFYCQSFLAISDNFRRNESVSNSTEVVYLEACKKITKSIHESSKWSKISF